MGPHPRGDQPKIPDEERTLVKHWLLDNDIAIVDHQKGLIASPPQWLRLILAGQGLNGVKPWELMGLRTEDLNDDDLDFWIEVGMLMREIEADAHNRAQPKGKSGKVGKR